LNAWVAHYDRSVAQVGTLVAVAGGFARPDGAAGNELQRRLTNVTLGGDMPSFADPGALSHYTLQHMRNRAQKLTAVLLLDELRPILTRLFRGVGRGRLEACPSALRMAVVGGGPGFEALGLAALLQHLGLPIAVDCLVMDIERAWAPVVQAVAAAITAVIGPCGYRDNVAAAPISPPAGHALTFVAADCLTAAAGPELLTAAGQTHLFTFNYCCVENAHALRSSGFAYLQSVFAAAPPGAVFVFMDASYHLWDELAQAFGAVAGCCFSILHPHPQPWQCRNTMVVDKLA